MGSARSRVLATVWPAVFPESRIGSRLHHKVWALPPSQSRALPHEFRKPVKETRIALGGCGPLIVKPEFTRGSEGLRVEVIDHLHVVGDETNRGDHDVFYACRGEVFQVVINVGFKPFLAGGPRAGTKGQRPWELAAGRGKPAIDGARHREMLSQIGPALPENVLLAGYRQEAGEILGGEIRVSLAEVAVRAERVAVLEKRGLGRSRRVGPLRSSD